MWWERHEPWRHRLYWHHMQRVMRRMVNRRRQPRTRWPLRRRRRRTRATPVFLLEYIVPRPRRVMRLHMSQEGRPPRERPIARHEPHGALPDPLTSIRPTPLMGLAMPRQARRVPERLVAPRDVAHVRLLPRVRPSVDGQRRLLSMRHKDQRISAGNVFRTTVSPG